MVIRKGECRWWMPKRLGRLKSVSNLPPIKYSEYCPVITIRILIPISGIVIGKISLQLKKPNKVFRIF